MNGARTFLKIDIPKPTADKIRWLHVELSTNCNAWCPACPRNKNGYGLADGLVVQDLPTARLEEVLMQLPNLEVVQFCGNLGEPIAAQNIIDAITIAKKYSKKIQIHTNGSLRNAAWWRELATLLGDIEHDVWFGIDGLSGVHEIYRQATSFEKIIENASAFIDNGGYASWQFIPYVHNQHQIKDCMRLSQKLKFKHFRLAKKFRERKRTAYHYKTGEEYFLEKPTIFGNLINVISAPKDIVEVSDCQFLSQPSIYLAANGQLSFCCYWAQQQKTPSVDSLLNESLDLKDKTCLTNCGKNQ